MKAAVIGTGMRAQECVIPALLSLPQIQVTAISDLADENIEKALALFPEKPRVEKDWRKLLSDPSVDGIVLITPNYLHAPMACGILRAGKPLYLEKPMGISAADCEQICQTADQTGTPVMVGMQLRYSDAYGKMKQFVDQGRIGRLKMIHYTQLRQPLRGGWQNWLLDRRYSGGSIIEITVHHLDLFNWFAASNNARVAAFGGQDVICRQGGMLDNSLIIMEYGNGVRADIEAALFVHKGAVPRNGLYLTGTEGFMYLEGGSEIVITRFDTGESEHIATRGLDGMDALAMMGFYRMAALGEKPLTTPLDGKMAVVAAMAAEKSIESGTIVDFDKVAY